MSDDLGPHCPGCGGPMDVGPVRITERLQGVLYQCLPCDWLAIQPESSRMPVGEFLSAAFALEGKGRG